MSEKHSKIGASSMYRWSACPGSVKLSEGLSPTQSRYAEEGTKAHEQASQYLTQNIFTLNKASLDEAVRVYVDEIEQVFKPKYCTLLIEHKFDLSSIHPGLYGTADAVIWDKLTKRLTVYDYKHGSGIPVEVYQNKQLMYYALGALVDTQFPAREVEMVIVQPRCYHEKGFIRRWIIPALQLLDFAAELKEAALETEKENALLVPGEHCRFCPAAGICPEIHKQALTVAKTEFKPAFSYDPDELAKALNWLPTLEGWIENVRKFAYSEALRGKEIPGFKLVEKRKTRKWRNENEVITYLNEIWQYELDQIMDMKLKSPAQIEKIIHKLDKEKLQDLIESSSSGLSLVPSTDSRAPVIQNAKNEFTPIEGNS